MAPRDRRPSDAPRSRGESGGEAVGLTTFLIDNSALQRAQTPDVARALESLNASGKLATCLPLQLEAGFSTKNLAELDSLAQRLFGRWEILRTRPKVGELALDLQRALFAAGMGRAAGAFDIQVGAFALAETLAGSPTTIVHYDEDYEHLRQVEPRLRTSWVVPPGSVA